MTEAAQAGTDLQIVGTKTRARLIAMILDNLIATLLAMVVSAKLPGIDTLERSVTLVCMYLAYYALSEGFWSRTPMKYVFGLTVIRDDGSRAGGKEALIRTFARLIDVNPLLLGALPGALLVAFSLRHQRMGDMLAKTVVMSEKEGIVRRRLPTINVPEKSPGSIPKTQLETWSLRILLALAILAALIVGIASFLLSR